jgi:splicing factor 3A subunit 1
MEAEGMPPAKRQKVAKLPGGQCYPEADWINMHPVSVLFPAENCTEMLTWYLASNITSSAAP